MSEEQRTRRKIRHRVRLHGHHHHDHHDHDHEGRGHHGRQRSPEERLAHLEAHRRDVEEYLADLSEKINRLQASPEPQ